MKNKYQICAIALFLVVLCQLNVVHAKDASFSVLQEKQLESVFSSMANAQMPTFNSGKVTNEALIRFGVIHNIRNSQKAFTPTAKNSEIFKLADKNVDSAASKFFGKRVSRHQTVGEWKHKSNYYLVSLNEAGGDLVCDITKAINYGSGSYKVFFNVNEDWADSKELVSKKSVLLKKSSQGGFVVLAYGDSK